MSNNQLTDISVVAQLSELEVLGLGDNHISDINPLAALLRLRDLDTRNNPITDISVLAGLPLTRLVLGVALIDDISVLSLMSELTDLEILGYYQQINKSSLVDIN